LSIRFSQLKNLTTSGQRLLFLVHEKNNISSKAVCTLRLDSFAAGELIRFTK